MTEREKKSASGINNLRGFVASKQCVCLLGCALFVFLFVGEFGCFGFLNESMACSFFFFFRSLGKFVDLRVGVARSRLWGSAGVCVYAYDLIVSVSLIVCSSVHYFYRFTSNMFLGEPSHGRDASEDSKNFLTSYHEELARHEHFTRSTSWKAFACAIRQTLLLCASRKTDILVRKYPSNP